MDILLIEPPYKSLKGIGTEHGYSINVTSLAAYLHSHGMDAAVLTGDLLSDLPVQASLTFDVKKYAKGQKDYANILDDAGHLIWSRIRDYIRRLHPLAVGITYLTPAGDLVNKIAGLVKEVDGDIKVIAGGHHPTYCPDETLKNPDIDYVVRGEGEIPLLRLMENIKTGTHDTSSVPGITYRRDGGVVSNADCAMIHDLDSLPIPKRDLVLDCDYTRHKGHYILTARGCPYTCAFCSDSRLWHGKVRRRSVKNVIEEIKYLVGAYDVDFIDFVDGTFTYDENYIREFCNSLADEKLKIKWRCTARYDNIDEEMLELMKKANCSGMYLGLESGSDRILKSIDKRFSTQDIIRASELVADSGISSITAVMMGLPEEEKQDIEDTLSLMKKIRTNIWDVNCYVPLPGTALYNGEKVDWRKAGYKSYGNYFTNKITLEELQEYLAAAYQIAENTQMKFQKRGGWKAKT